MDTECVLEKAQGGFPYKMNFWTMRAQNWSERTNGRRLDALCERFSSIACACSRMYSQWRRIGRQFLEFHGGCNRTCRMSPQIRSNSRGHGGVFFQKASNACRFLLPIPQITAASHTPVMSCISEVLGGRPQCCISFHTGRPNCLSTRYATCTHIRHRDIDSEGSTLPSGRILN